MRVSFQGVTLDDSTRQLARGGETLHLSPKAFCLLQLLVERRPAVVERSEIVARIWPGVTVSEASLGGLVKEIRRVLGDDPARPSFIRTVHTVGYAFVARVDEEGTASTETDQGAYRCWLTWDDRTLALRGGENLIGRDPRCPVWLDAYGVSRRHARIMVDGGEGATIEDLGSRNGTTVSGTALTARRRLEDGDRIELGTVTLGFRQWAESRAPRTEPIGRRVSARAGEQHRRVR